MYNWPNRKNLRLSNYDYSSNWFYFVTICSKNRENYFWEIMDWKMILNEYGKITYSFWKNIEQHYPRSKIDYFVIMPNHIHWIIIIENETNRNVENENICSLSWIPRNVENENICSLLWTNQNVGDENFRSLREHKTNVSNIIKWFKIWCTKEIRQKYDDLSFWWQKSFFDVIIRNDEQLEKTREYIVNNPLKWEFDKNNPVNIK